MPSDAAPAVRPSAWSTAWPFLLGAALLTFVLARIDYEAFARHLSSTNYAAYLAFALVFNAALVSADAFAIRHLYARLLAKVSYRDVFVLRAASYLPSLLNYHVGQGWLTYFVSRTYGVPLWRVAGVTLVIYVTVFGCLFALALAGLALNAAQFPWLPSALGGVGLAGALYLGIVLLRPRVLQRQRTTAVPLELGVVGHFRAVLWRVPHVGVLFIGTWVPFLLFDVDIPLSHALVLVPPLMFVVALPISPQGVGTRDVFAQQVFVGYAHGVLHEQRAAVAAATLTWACATTLIQASMSPFFMRKARQLLHAQDNAVHEPSEDSGGPA